MKKYWKIQGQEGLWVLHREAPHFRWFRQDGKELLRGAEGSASRVVPASFEEIHGRPKPPEIYGGRGRRQYEADNPKVVTVYYSRSMKRWHVLEGVGAVQFPTHAEAIAYAQKHAHQ